MTKGITENMLSRTRAACLVGAILAVSACGTTTADAPPVESSATTTPNTSAPSASKLADVVKGGSDSTGNKPGDVVNGLPTKKDLANDGKGNYIQTTIAGDDPAMQYNPAIVNPDVFATYTEEEVKDFQKFVVTFIAEESIDSVLNDNHGDVATQDAWWAKNKDKFDPTFHDDILTDLRSNTPDKPFVFRAQLRGNKYSLVNGDDVTHVFSRKITPTTIRSKIEEGRPLIGLQASVEFAMNAFYNGNVAVEASNAQVSYTATKNESGKWQFTGYYSTYSTSPVVH